MITINRKFHSEFLVAEAKAGGRHRTTGTKYQDGCSIYMKFFTWTSHIGLFPFAVLFLLRPNERVHYYLYMPGQSRSTISLVLYFMWEYYTYCWQVSVCYLLWYIQMLYANSCNFWLQQLRQVFHSIAITLSLKLSQSRIILKCASCCLNRDSAVSWTRLSPRGTSSSIRIFKSLQILTTMFNNSFQTALLPLFNMFLVGVQVLSLFICVRFHSELPIILITGCAICVLVTFSYVLMTYTKIGRITDSSAKFLRSPDGIRSKQWRQVKRSLPQLNISIGGCYNLQRHSVLTFVLLVCTATSNLLVSTS